MNRPTLFFVDDSETILSSTKIATQELPINIEQFLSAVDALKVIESGEKIPDLVITDLNMPEMDGFQFLEALRENRYTKRIPILMLTTEAGEDKKQRGKEMGLTGWIVKPFVPKQLQQAIRRVLRIR
jgi:two-component system chemotaxis response regulator CheY